ncbi:hypothetical protein M430DRAFT_69038 [Amorphotheca resinae ATCC 22711]|uniref:Uncharacterized protein n=1 Tax=Amorphotheca resinae ATCC 22711 TaxID=857342 RepID=A0A2T3ASV8_AMORE|nr:hypothetical protein M430DRAFT_69038 [Amorphotheca resinae ATCC 22711]PSS10566.1 hypothetical protein M430DRAFT_69038 [Amorphotheca resinae ATCC 22711]
MPSIQRPVGIGKPDLDIQGDASSCTVSCRRHASLHETELHAVRARSLFSASVPPLSLLPHCMYLRREH